MGRGTLGEVWTGRRTLVEVWEGQRDPWGGWGWVGGLSGRSGTGRGTREEVKYGSGDPPIGLGRDRAPSKRPKTFRVVQNGSDDPRGSLGLVGEPSGRFGMGRGTLGEVRSGSGDTQRG